MNGSVKPIKANIQKEKEMMRRADKVAKKLLERELKPSNVLKWKLLERVKLKEFKPYINQAQSTMTC